MKNERKQKGNKKEIDALSEFIDAHNTPCAIYAAHVLWYNEEKKILRLPQGLNGLEACIFLQ